VNAVFTKQMSQFCSKLAKVVHGVSRWNNQIWESGGQRSGLHDAKVR